jgi:hypothetical protein
MNHRNLRESQVKAKNFDPIVGAFGTSDRTMLCRGIIYAARF